ncbi:MAG: 4-hydroxy-3-methylbut-2-enyl diphosphate reductase [Bacteroidales bacterium]|nr:4-hydroxy-3-methylbut-2-enyl diphosphate reductase [Bacteroidales bacterium]
MNVEIDPHSGFCFGVRRAIATLEARLDCGEDVYCVGDIVHNGREIDRLRAKGLRVIEARDLGSLHDANVLFRAHGEPPSSYDIVSQNGLSLTDATCPVVLRLQTRIREADDRMTKVGGQVVIFGKKGHAEVIGLMGQIKGRGILVENEGQVELVDATAPVELFAQTTKNPADYDRIAQVIKSRTTAEVTVHQTICQQMASRAERMGDFAKSHSPVIFVGGAKSSNSKVLFDICRQINPKCYFVTDEDEVRTEWFADVEGPVGIIGATSTPLWLMERVKERIEVMIKE